MNALAHEIQQAIDFGKVADRAELARWLGGYPGAGHADHEPDVDAGGGAREGASWLA